MYNYTLAGIEVGSYNPKDLGFNFDGVRKLHVGYCGCTHRFCPCGCNSGKAELAHCNYTSDDEYETIDIQICVKNSILPYVEFHKEVLLHEYAHAVTLCEAVSKGSNFLEKLDNINLVANHGSSWIETAKRLGVKYLGGNVPMMGLRIYGALPGPAWVKNNDK